MKTTSDIIILILLIILFIIPFIFLIQSLINIKNIKLKYDDSLINIKFNNSNIKIRILEIKIFFSELSKLNRLN